MQKSKKNSDKMAILKSDGNGGYNIQKDTMALIMMTVALLSCVASVVAYGATIRSDVNWLKEEYQEAGPRHTGTIEIIEERLDGFDNHISGSEVLLNTMLDDIKEIKSDVKGLISK